MSKYILVLLMLIPLVADAQTHRRGGRKAAGGAAVSFVPSDSTDLIMWFAADSLDMSDGDTISTWPNLGDSTWDAISAFAPAADNPIYTANILNGKPVARFDGSYCNMNVETVVATWSNISFWIVLSPTSGTDNDYIMVFLKTDHAVIGGYSDSLWEWFSQPSRDTLDEMAIGSFQILTDTASVANADDNDLGKFIIAGSFDNTDEFTGDIAEIIVYGHNATATLKSSIETYLQTKYGAIPIKPQ